MAAQYDGSIKIDSEIDTKGAEDSLKKLSGELKDFEKTAGSAEDGFSKLSSGLKNLAGAFGLAFGLGAIKSFGQEVIEVTASLQAMEAQFDQIFKGSEGVAAMAEINNLSEEVGVHVDRLTGSFNKFGAQVKGAGMDAGRALEATGNATRLAADAAAFYDVSLESASGSIASFMKGNFEAGDAIGVFTNAKQMDTKANEMYRKSWADLNEAERQWLLLDTVQKTYEQSGAIGQSQRETDSWANVTENLRAQWNRLLEEIGAPVLAGAISVAKGLGEAIGALMLTLRENPETVKAFSAALLGLLAGIALYVTVHKLPTMIKGLSESLSAFGKTADVFGKSVKGMGIQIAIAGAAFFVLYDLFQRITAAWDEMTGSEKIVAALGAITVAAIGAAFAVGAFQSAASMGLAAAGIVVGIAAIAVAIRDAESKIKAQTAYKEQYYGGGTAGTGGWSAFSAPMQAEFPHLAHGAVIPPNREFLAVLGDQKHGTNIEAPLSTIEGALENVLARRGANGGGPVQIELIIGAKSGFTRYLSVELDDEARRKGVKLVNA